jgi:dipeptidyl aminopeptidase/acylaminoacyl peptidase
MSWKGCFACILLGLIITSPVIFSQSASIAPRTLKDKIVFVHADPTVRVTSLRSITDVDMNSGAVVGSHGGPELDASAASNHVKDEIELMNPDGSSIIPLHIFGSDPMLSPDGTRIVYCSGRDTLYWQVYVMDADGKGGKRLTDTKTGDACGPAWSPDEKKIAYYAYANTHPSRNPEIWVMDADGSNPKKLVDHGMDPSWSPDGRQIAFASRRDGVFQIYAMNSDGSNLHRLTKSNVESSTPAWAPDGKSIAYVSATADDRRGLFVMNADGSQPQALVHSKHQDFCFPTWSRDGQLIIFTALNRLGSQGILTGEEKPRCEQWSGEYQIFAVTDDLKIKQLTNAKTMGMRPSYGQVASAP